MAAEKSTCFLAFVLDGTDGGLDGWMGWAGGCHRKCGTACRAVDTANHTFSHSQKQARSLQFNGSSHSHLRLHLGSFALASIGSKPSAIQNQYPFSFFGWKKGFLCSLNHKSYLALFFPPGLAQRPDPRRHFCPESHPCTGGEKREYFRALA